MTPFALYPVEQRWWSMADYGAVLSVMQRLHPARVLEFGPGSSTLALIEGGASRIDTCEDDPKWADVYQRRLVVRFAGLVRLHRYEWTEPLTIGSVDAERFDLALIDGPHGTWRRPNVLSYCLPRCESVLIPTEDDAHQDFYLRPAIAAIAEEYGRAVEWIESGPLSGGFALVTRPC